MCRRETISFENTGKLKGDAINIKGQDVVRNFDRYKNLIEEGRDKKRLFLI